MDNQSKDPKEETKFDVGPIPEELKSKFIKYETPLVQTFDNMYSRISNLNEKRDFLINVFIEYRNEHSFGEYDYMVEIDEKTEVERGEISTFLVENFMALLESPESKWGIKETVKANSKLQAKHYVLSYLIECNAKGESYPIGQKKVLEKIGSEKMGAGKGNRFYKVFNEVIKKDLNVENNLIEIGGENWRTIVKDLSNEPETIEKYLKIKHL